jgi:hypothetical protein
MKLIVKLLLITTPLLLIYGCYYDKEIDLYPNTYAAPVDLNNVSYSKNVVPVLSQCNSCHAVKNSSIFISGTWADLNTYLSNANNNLICSIDWTCSGGAHKMPQGGNQLSSTQIQTIKNWVSQGHKNN